MNIEKCPGCDADASKLALMEYPIGEPYLWYVYCTQCGFCSAAQDTITGAIKKWSSYVKEINERKAIVIKNRDELIKRGII